jgi:predicted dehydrogenase
VSIEPAPDPKETLGVALIGAGNLARWQHLPNVKKAGARVQAVFSSSGVRGRSYAERFGAAYCTSEYSSILADPHVDVVLVASRNQHHAEESLSALRAGKHVFVEKPMCLTEDECRELVRAVQETGKQLTVGFNRRFAPYYAELKQALKRRSGPAVLNCRINSPGISGSYWMADPAIGGAILGEACHFVDLMYWLLESEPLDVAAFSLPTGRKDPIGDNNIAASFRFADGSVGNLTYCTVGSKSSGGERVEVFAGGVGAWTQDFKSIGIQNGTAKTKSKWWAEKGYENQMRRFLASVKEGRAPDVTVIDGARATLGCIRMMEAAKSGRVLALDLERVIARTAAA